jgi:hypothetical protein
VNDDDQIDQPKTEGKLPTGVAAMLAPLFTWQGKAVYAPLGAEVDDGEAGDQDSESDTDDNDDDTGDGAKDKGSDTVSREEFETLRRQLSAADKNKSTAEKKLKEIEDAKKGELQKATERVTELEKSQAQDRKDLAEMRLQNAFLTADTGITWHDPADALALAERQGYLAEVVDEDGKVDAGKLTSKLKELAKAKPHLVKQGKQEDQQDDKKSKTPPTGSKVGGKSGGGKDEPNLSRYDRLLNR